MAETIAAFSPYGVDLSSAAETNGVKDKNKMQKLVRSVHHE
jgi:phosphoribosylanthranilate isomerase